MSEARGLGSKHLWGVASLLVAMALLSLPSHAALTSQVTDNPPPVVATDSGSNEDEAADQTAADDAPETDTPAEEAADTEEPAEEGTSKKEPADKEPPSDDSVDKSVDEESDPEIEVEPSEEEQEPSSQQRNGKQAPPAKKKKRVIGATATVLEKQSGLLFRARVDTGSKSCSLHVEEMVIEDKQEKWVDNIGKVVRFKVENRSKETHWLEGRIDGYVIIKTSDTRERRYKVPLVLRWKGIEKKVLVTLNNRNGMEYPLLLGRNFLRKDFLVDVEMDADD